MNSLIDLWEMPDAEQTFMIAGWRQWADAGAISSGLPQYLAEHLNAAKIGEIKPRGFYLFQIPGTHHLLRPVIKLSEGHRQSLEAKKNEFSYARTGDKGLIIFLGDEPHQNHEQYAAAFLDAAAELGVQRIAAVAGVYGAMPYDRDREVSCAYSLPSMKEELTHYALKLSDYEGGSTIGTYLADQAEYRDVEFVVFYAFVPSYDFAHASANFSGIQVGRDLKAWYDLMRRLNHMFDLHLDLKELEVQSDELIASVEAQIEKLGSTMPQLKVEEYMEEIARNFEERPFMPFHDMWEQELGDLFEDLDE